MYDSRVNIILHENPEIVEKYESGHLDEQSAVMQVMAEINANTEMRNASADNNVVLQCSRQALDDAQYRERGVYEQGDSVTVYSWARKKGGGLFAFDIRESEDRVGPVDTGDLPEVPFDGGSHDLSGTVARREGAQYYVTLDLTGDTVGPLGSDGFFS